MTKTATTLACLIPLLIIGLLFAASAYFRYERCMAQGGQYEVWSGSCEGLVTIIIHDDYFSPPPTRE